jgi:hypothetical protein
MDLFRKNKKKQSDELTQQTIQSMTDALDRMAMTGNATTSNEELAATSSIHHVIMNATDTAGSIISSGGKATASSSANRFKSGPVAPSAAGIDALIDSDEDLAEIFNDGDSDDDDGGNVSMVSEGSHVVGGDGSRVSLSPRQKVDGKNGSNPYGGKNSGSAADADVEASRARLHNQKNLNHSKKHHNRLADNVSSSEDDGDDDDEDDEDHNTTSDDEPDDDDDERDAEDDKSNSDSAEDYTDDEDEGEDGYKPGGYHSVKVGEVFNQR